MIVKTTEYVSCRIGISAGFSMARTAAIYSAAFQRADKKAADKLKKEQA